MLLDPLSISIDPPIVPAVSGPPKPRRYLLERIPSSPDFIMRMDYSSITPFLECARRGENALVYAREDRRSHAALDWGSCFHAVEELRLLHGMSDSLRVAQCELISKWFVDHPVALDEYRNAGRMIDVTEKYNQLYCNDNWPGMVLRHDGAPCVERPFEIELCSIPVDADLKYPPSILVRNESESPETSTPVGTIHCLLIGKIDVILETPSGIWVPDHKTTSRGGKEWEEAFGLSLQSRGYCHAAKRLGFPVQGAILNGVITRPITKSGKGTEFLRQSYPYSTDVLTDYEESMRLIFEDLLANLVRGKFPQHARSFKSPCGGCDYQSNCRLPFHQRLDDLFSALYQDKTWSPLGEDE